MSATRRRRRRVRKAVRAPTCAACSSCLAGVFVLKLLVVLQLRDHPLLQPDAGLDTTAYVELAGGCSPGDLALGPGLYYVSPLYIYFLAAGAGRY